MILASEVRLKIFADALMRKPLLFNFNGSSVKAVVLKPGDVKGLQAGRENNSDVLLESRIMLNNCCSAFCV